MALNKVFNGDPNNNRVRPLASITAPSTAPTTIQPGVPVLMSGRPAVSLTASGNGTKTVANPGFGVTSLTYQNGGAGLAADEATFAFDGSYEFAVSGATTSTLSDVPVYITPATGALTLTASGNTAYGRTDYPKDYRKQAGRAVVKIGA